MGLVPYVTVLFFLSAFATSGAVAATRRFWQPSLRAYSPTTRVWWLSMLLAAPAVIACATVALVLGPSCGAMLGGVPDHCHYQLRHAHVCLVHAPHAGAFAWAVAALFAAWPAVSLARFARAALSAGQLRRRVANHAMTADDKLWVVPGSASFVIGWLHPVICIGVALRERLAEPELRAVLAHEHAHIDRRDPARRLAAGLVSSLHLFGAAASLRAELDLAVEQACDVRAADAVGDPLVVADALLHVARLHALAPTVFALAFVDTALEARVEALCAPAWRSPRGLMHVVLGLAAVCALAAISFDAQVHDAGEAIVRMLLAAG